MSQPSNVDKNRLMAMLGGAKAVMDKVESGNFESGNVNENQMMPTDKLLEKLPDNYQQNSNYVPNEPIPLRNLHTTKMDPNIVRAMVNNPMPTQENINSTFSLEDVNGMTKKPQIAESVYSPTNGERVITLTESQLDTKIKSALLDFMTTTFTKALTESTIKKTITTLIKEGKIKVRAKK